MTVDEFRMDPDRVAQAQRILNDPLFRTMVECVKNSSPLWEQVSSGPNYTAEDRVMDLGIIKGHAYALSQFSMLGRVITQQPPMEPDYGAGDFNPFTRKRLARQPKLEQE